MRAKRNILVIAGVTMVAIAVVSFVPRAPGPKGSALATRQQAMELLGAEIAKLRPNCKVLALSNPLTKESSFLNERSQYDRVGLRGLRKGLGRRSPVYVAYPDIRPEYLTNPQSIPVPSDCRTPLSFLLQTASVDQLAEAHPDCTVIVSLIGLPLGVDKLKVWDEKDPRSFALLLPDLRLLGSPAEARSAFERGKLLTAVVEDPKTRGPLIVTRDNIVEVLERQPRVFGY